MTIILLIGCNCQKCFSQSNAVVDSAVIDGMLEELRQLKESNLKEAFARSKVIGQKAKKINYQKGIWEARIEQGFLYNALGQADSSLSVIQQVLNETKEHHDRLSEIKAHLGLALTYQQNFKFQPGVDHLGQAEKLLKSEDAFDLRFEILKRQGTIHRAMKDYSNALKYYKTIEDHYFEQLTPKQKFYLYMNQGNVFADQKEYAKTEALFKKAYQAIQQEDSPINQAIITYNLGALLYRQKRLEEAKLYINRALEANIKIGDRARIDRCYEVLGSIYLDQKDYEKAKKYHNAALEIALSIKNPNAVMSSYNNLYLTYWNMGYSSKHIEDLDKALNYFQKYSKIKDSLYQIETAGKVLELEKQYESEKKNSQIALLEKETQHQQDQILMERAQRKYMILIILMVSVTLGVSVYFVYYYKKINKLLKTQRKSILEQKLQISDQNKQLQKLINTQNRLFSIIAHDLRSPLVSIFNISSIIEYQINDKEYEALEKTAEKMNQKIMKILGLTDNLLCWAQSQSGNFEPNMVPLNIHEIVEECLEIYHPIAVDKNITIDYKPKDELIVMGDRNMVRTICRNLINNAIKFTHKNGRIKIGQEFGEQWVRISIKDSGVGIPPDKLKELFEISQTKISSDTSGEKSSGLGLSLCREFVDAMKGKIWVESQQGAGSKFTFELVGYKTRKQEPKSKPSVQMELSV